MKKTLPFIILAFAMISANAQDDGNRSGTVVTFKFPAANDMFYIPWNGNDAELHRLYTLTDDYRTQILDGSMPVYVDGYCASLPTAKENLNIAFIRSNRVKSELITHKGLLEAHFITANHATAYEGSTDMVVVTLRIPAKAEAPRTQPVREAPEVRTVPEPQPEPVAEKPSESVPATVEQATPTTPTTPYRFAIRTNLLYDAFLLPTLGIEWRVNRTIGIKIDGSRSWWGDELGKVQKIWLVSPEVRWYLGGDKRFYTGVLANYGEFNVYRGMIGRLKSDDTGYQGKLWNAGFTAGYQLYLSRCFSLDFNVGLGYTRFEYDTFYMNNDTRVYQAKDRTKNFFGPTQAGISLIWTLGGNK